MDDNKAPLENICIVLKDTSHPGNIGASARAMKTMGFSRLRLACAQTLIDDTAVAMASGADDVLTAAKNFSDLPQAIADCNYVFALTARRRDLSPPALTVRDSAREIAQHAHAGARVAVLFGGERAGLENRDVQLACRSVEIGTSPGYSSLNLSHAVQIVCHEIRQALMQPCSPQKPRELPTRREFDDMMAHLEQALDAVGLPKKNDTRVLEPRLRRLLTRADMDSGEVRLLRGIYRAILANRQDNSE